MTITLSSMQMTQWSAGCCGRRRRANKIRREAEQIRRRRVKRLSWERTVFYERGAPSGWHSQTTHLHASNNITRDLFLVRTYATQRWQQKYPWCAAPTHPIRRIVHHNMKRLEDCHQILVPASIVEKQSQLQSALALSLIKGSSA